MTPRVSDYMTPTPYTISKDQWIGDAADLMRAFEIRTLPVLEGGRLIGSIGERELLRVRDDDIHAIGQPQLETGADLLHRRIVATR